MTTTAPTFSQIRAQVAAIRQKVPRARVIGIHSSGRWTGERRKQDGEERYAIDQCDSLLAMRIALRDDDNEETKILITSLDDDELDNDIRVRLTKRQLFRIKCWQIVKSLFQAHAIDPRLACHAWIAEYLMEAIPTDGYPPVTSGFLDAETVWPVLLEHGMGLTADRPDLLALLKWSIDPQNVMRFKTASETFRQAATEWLTRLAGPTAEAVLDSVQSNEKPDALPVGLAAGVVFHPDAAGRLDKATGKMEARYWHGKELDQGLIERWNAAATEVVRWQLSSEPKVKRHQLQRADEILREVGAESFAYLSDTLTLGFEQRLTSFGDTLKKAIGKGAPKSLDSLDRAKLSLTGHDQASRERRRIERVDMALRLTRWLRRIEKEPAEPRSLAEAAQYQLLEGGFVDWARLSLRSGDPVRELSEAYATLFDKVTGIREAQSKQFAELLRDSTAAGSASDDLVPAERILEKVVAPLASQTPVLVILIDGMSVAVFRELMTDIAQHEWVALAEEGSAPRPGLATIPSVTEVARTSLLCGRLTQGNASTEKAGFSEHPALLEHCRAGSPPILFHKAALQESEDASLAADIRKEIGSSHRRIVGVVINAVDDHLLKGDQIDTRWTRDEIRVLPVLLHEARTARRTVVLVSDHGHVLDSGAKGQSHEGGERWRFDEGEPAEGELRVAGPRVVIPEAKALIAPWTERVRYGVKKNGYHGGLTPQEMVVPIGVLSTAEAYPAGWTDATVDTPVWWDEFAGTRDAPKEKPPKLKPAKPKPTGLLFDLDGEETTPPVAEEAAVVDVADWIKALLSSPVFKEQKQLGGRAVPTDEVFSNLLVALDGRGGKITSAALARAIGYSPMRLRGLLAVAGRVLNIDGYAVLGRDDASDTVELDRDLLCKQFDLV